MEMDFAEKKKRAEMTWKKRIDASKWDTSELDAI